MLMMKIIANKISILLIMLFLYVLVFSWGTAWAVSDLHNKKHDLDSNQHGISEGASAKAENSLMSEGNENFILHEDAEYISEYIIKGAEKLKTDVPAERANLNPEESLHIKDDAEAPNHDSSLNIQHEDNAGQYEYEANIQHGGGYDKNVHSHDLSVNATEKHDLSHTGDGHEEMAGLEDMPISYVAYWTVLIFVMIILLIYFVYRFKHGQEKPIISLAIFFIVFILVAYFFETTPIFTGRFDPKNYISIHDFHEGNNLGFLRFVYKFILGLFLTLFAFLNFNRKKFDVKQ